MRAVTALAVGLASAGALTLSWVEGLRPAVAPSVAVGRARPSPAALPGATVPNASAPRSRRPHARSGAVRPRPAATAPAAVPHVVEGPSIQTQYGSVQVAVDYKGTRITDVVALHLTDSSGTSVAISAGAAPELRREALVAQSARIDLVSGATFTSTAYAQSLQAALDAAHL